MVPLVKTVQKNVKSIVKSKDVPDEYLKELSSIVYFSKFFTMPAFERVKAQLGYRYGQKFVDRIVVKGKTENVDEDVVENLNYECEKGEVKDKMKELTKSSDTRAKEEARQIQESNQALTSVFVPSFGGSSSKSTSTKDKKSKKSKKESSDDSDESSEEEKEKSEAAEEKPKDVSAELQEVRERVAVAMARGCEVVGEASRGAQGAEACGEGAEATTAGSGQDAGGELRRPGVFGPGLGSEERENAKAR